MHTIESLVVTVPAEKWAERLKLKAEAAALAKKLELIDKELNLPDPKAIGKAVQIVVKDGNGDIRGKGSVFHYPGANIPPSWRMRIS